MLAEPGHYDYAPYSGRPKIVWPGGARIAVWLAPNIEHYELEPPDNPRKTPWPRPTCRSVCRGWPDRPESA